jgi:hypothetical protein
MKANNYAMKDWHLEHVEKVIVRYVKGVSPDASSFEKRNYKKYSTVSSCGKQIEYDIKHGVTHEEVMAVVQGPPRQVFQGPAKEPRGAPAP